MKEILVCSMCGRKLTEDSVNEFDNQVMCEHCFEEQTVLCSNCGDRIWRDNAEGDSHNVLCSHCYDNYYNNCERCGRLIHNDDTYYEDEDSDYPYCYECFQKIQTRPIKDYNYKPEPVFYGSGNLFYGIELEIDKGGEIDENAQILLDIANKDSERLYCKHDGSLHDGFECVSFPHTLEEHINAMPWGKILDKAIELGYRSHNTSTAGLHIHASRSAFGKSYEQQEQNVAKLVYFVEKHWNELVKFSRRTFENLNRWAAKYATISDTTEETYKKAKDKRMGRYVAVNLENYDMIAHLEKNGIDINIKQLVKLLNCVKLIEYRGSDASYKLPKEYGDKTRWFHVPKSVVKELQENDIDSLYEELGLILDAEENMKANKSWLNQLNEA